MRPAFIAAELDVGNPFHRGPLLIANDPSVAERIANTQADRFGPLFPSCSYSTFRDLSAWHRRSAIMLVVATTEDVEDAASIIQEARIRQSPLSMILVQVGPSEPALDALEPYVACRLAWPQKASELAAVAATFVPNNPPKESIAEGLAARLAWYTPSLLPQAHRLTVAAHHDIPVLLTGETGCGKTYLARLLHQHSPRRKHPFLTVPCGAQPSGLFESNFFGHVKGAFTGAHQTRPGKFAAAGKGTILLDEIDTLTLEQQAGLLRVIETGEYEIVGCNETRKSEARIIVASNWDLEGSVSEGRFRQDLFYRLNVMSFYLPPLRERREDIAALARTFVAHYNGKYRKGLFEISDEALAAIEASPWPGNIRQLENVMQQAVLISKGPLLKLDDLPTLISRPIILPRPHLNLWNHKKTSPFEPQPAETMPIESLIKNRAAYERSLIQKTLETCDFNRSSTARALGISRVTLYKKIKQYGLTNLPLRSETPMGHAGFHANGDLSNDSLPTADGLESAPLHPPVAEEAIASNVH